VLPYYNLTCWTGGGRCGPHTPETKRKIGIANKGKTAGRKHTAERCDALAKGQTAYWATVEGVARKAQQSTAIEGWRDSINEGIRVFAASGKLSEVRTEVARRPESSRRQSELMKRRWADPEIAAAMSTKSKYVFKSEATRAKRHLNLLKTERNAATAAMPATAALSRCSSAA
jgi:hypothetical protein